MNSLETEKIISHNGIKKQCIKMIIDSPNEPFVFNSLVKENNQYMIHFYVKSANGSQIKVEDKYIETTTEWQYKARNFIAKDTNLKMYLEPDTYYFDEFMVEIGNLDSDYSPSPDDIQEQFDSIQEIVDFVVDKENKNIKADVLTNSFIYQKDENGNYILDDSGNKIPLSISSVGSMAYMDNERMKLMVSGESTSSSLVLTDKAITAITNQFEIKDKNGSTFIKGGMIISDVLQSQNYQADIIGSSLSLKDGSFDSKYLKWNKEGSIVATNGKIGNWSIQTDRLSWIGSSPAANCKGELRAPTTTGNNSDAYFLFATVEECESVPGEGLFTVNYIGEVKSHGINNIGELTTGVITTPEINTAKLQHLYSTNTDTRQDMFVMDAENNVIYSTVTSDVTHESPDNTYNHRIELGNKNDGFMKFYECRKYGAGNNGYGYSFNLTAMKNDSATSNIEIARITMAGIYENGTLLRDSYASKSSVTSLSATVSGHTTSITNINTTIGSLDSKYIKQGGGIRQGTNTVYIGWTGSRLALTVDNTDLGDFITSQNYNEYENAYLSAATEINFGGGNNSEKDLKFFSKDSKHKAYIYGGNTSSAISLGVWDDNIGAGVWRWDITNRQFNIDQAMYIHNHIYVDSGMVMNFNGHNTIYANENHDIRFGYGSYTNKAGKIYVHGDYLKFYTNQTNVYGNVAYSVSSDRRYKTNITDVDQKLLKVWKRINVKTFNYKSNQDFKNIGVIAQDVIKAFESENLNWKEYNVVTETFDDEVQENRYSVCYDGLNMLTMKVVQILLDERESSYATNN